MNQAARKEIDLDACAEFNKHAQRRMDDDLKPIDTLLSRWGREARDSGISIGWGTGTLLSRLIEEGPHGATQAGAPTPPITRELMIVDFCVAQLREITRQVIFEEYILSPGLPVEVKVRKLSRRLRIGLREAQWGKKLAAGREAVMAVYLSQI